MRISDWCSDVCASDLDQPVRGDHGEGLARALRVPDQAAALARLGAALGYLDRGAGLVLAQDGLAQFIVLDEEQDPVLQHPQEAVVGEKALDPVLVAAGLLLLPVEDELALQVPGDAVERSEERRVGKECVSTCRS